MTEPPHIHKMHRTLWPFVMIILYYYNNHNPVLQVLYHIVFNRFTHISISLTLFISFPCCYSLKLGPRAPPLSLSVSLCAGCVVGRRRAQTGTQMGSMQGRADLSTPAPLWHDPGQAHTHTHTHTPACIYIYAQSQFRLYIHTHGQR